jgi:raffinose/stachyose/melibiose transport system substrate-binding protein
MGKARYLMILAMALLLLAGISTAYAGGSGEAAGSAKMTGTITVGASQNWIKDVDREIAADFTKETGITIDYQVNPDDQYTNIIKTKLNTGEAPDIFMWPAGFELRQLPLDKVLDLSGEPWVGRLKDWAKKSGTVDGKLVGLNTWSIDGWGMVYNTAIFDTYSLKPPKNYAEFMAVCATLAKNGIIPVYEIPIDLWHTQLFLDEIASDANINAPGLYEKLNTNKAKFADVPEFMACLNAIKEMADKGYFGPTYMSDKWTGATEALGTGKYAMFLGYTSWQMEVAHDYPSSGAEKWKMFPSPLGAIGDMKSFGTSAGGELQLVYKSSKNIALVKKWLAYKTGVAVLNKYYAGRADLGNPSFPEVTKAPTAGLASMTDAVKGNFVPDGTTGILFWDMMGNGSLIQGMLAGQMTPTQALDAIDAGRAKVAKAAGTAGF